MNSEPELSAEARRLIVQAKDVDDPTDDDRQRVKTRWLASIATAASVSALGEVARAATRSGWGVKAAGAVLAVAAGAIGVYALLPTPPPTPSLPVPPAGHVAARSNENVPEPTPPRALPAPAVEAAANTPSSVDAPVTGAAPTAATPITEQPNNQQPSAAIVAATPVRAAKPPSASHDSAAAVPSAGVPHAPSPTPIAPIVPEPTSAEAPTRELGPGVEAVNVAATEPPPAPPEASASTRQLGEETLLLAEIRRNLQQGAARRALSLLSDYKRRFSTPLLGMEAAALRVDALCGSGDLAAGRAEAELFQATWPSSPLSRRVRSACQ